MRIDSGRIRTDIKYFDNGNMREKGDKVMNDILFIDVDSNRYDRVVIVK
jgi:hypothetical protein